MRILITEEALQSGSGHWPSYIGGIAFGLRELGDSVDVVVHQNASKAILNRVGGTAWFTRNCWLDSRSQGGLGGIRHNLIFRKEVTEWLRQHDPYDWVCAFTMRLQHLLAFAFLARSGAVPRETRFFLLFVQGFGRYVGEGKPTEFPCNPSTKLARFCFRLMESAVLSARVVLAAETKGMQEELQRFTGLPVTLAPHPVEFKSRLEQPEAGEIQSDSSFRCQISGFTTPLSSQQSVDFTESVKLSTLAPRLLNQPLTITCPGFARHEKGTDLFQQAIKMLLSLPDADRLHFVLQWPEPFAMPDGTILGPDPALLKDSRVELLNQNLNLEEYSALLSRTDLILLPYRRSSYHHRVSRVAIEAAGRGIPIIYTKETWLEEVAELAGCGVPIEDESAESVADALVSAAEDFPILKSSALLSIQSVKNYHSVATLRTLLENKKYG